MAKGLRLYYYLKPGDKTPRGMFDLNPNSLVLKVEQHSTSPAVADADHAKLYPISIFEREATKDENIRDAESRGKALRLYLLSDQDREAWVHGITEGIKFLKDPSTSGLTAPATSEDEDDHFDEGNVLTTPPRKRTGSNTSNQNVNVLRLIRKSNLEASSTKKSHSKISRSNDNADPTIGNTYQSNSAAKTSTKPRQSLVGNLMNITSQRFLEAARRGSTDGFDMSKKSDRLCVAYLRKLQTFSTEKSNIDNIFHPMLVQHCCKILKTPLSEKHADRIAQVENAYLSNYASLRPVRENVLNELRPRLEELTNALLLEVKRRRRIRSTGKSELAQTTEQMISTGIPVNRSVSTESDTKNRLVNGKIVVIVLKGINLRKVTQFKTQDPYVKLQASGSRKAVATNFCRHGGSNPRWSINDSNKFTFPISSYKSSLHVEAWNSNAIKDTLIGESDVDLSTFVDNPFITEKIWVGLKASNGDPAGRLLLTFKFVEQRPEQALSTNRTRNASTDSTDSASYEHNNLINDTYGNLFVGLPNMVVHNHIWGEKVICQVRLEDVSAQTVPFCPNKDMAEDGKISFIGWEMIKEEEQDFLAIRSVNNADENQSIGKPEDSNQPSDDGDDNSRNLDNTNNILSLPVTNAQDIVVFEAFQYNGDRKVLIGKASISLMEIMEVETVELFSGSRNGSSKGQENRTKGDDGVSLMPECCLQLTSEGYEGTLIGTLTVNTIFVQDIWKIFSPRIVEPMDKPFELSVFRENVARGNALLDIYDDCWKAYRETLDWKDPAFTGLLTTIFVFMCLFAFDNFLVVFPGSFVVFLIMRYRYRVDGSFGEIWHRDEMRKRIKLRIACIEGTDMTPMNQNALNPNDLTSDPYVVVGLGKGYEKDSIHIGRTNTEYLTLNPKWGMN